MLTNLFLGYLTMLFQLHGPYTYGYDGKMSINDEWLFAWYSLRKTEEIHEKPVKVLVRRINFKSDPSVTEAQSVTTLGSYKYWPRRHYATSRKVAGSIPDEVTGCFNWPTPSSRTMTLGSTQPLTEMSTRNFPGGKGRPANKGDNLTAICEPTV
jgi:hypothetical protein